MLLLLRTPGRDLIEKIAKRDRRGGVAAVKRHRGFPIREQHADGVRGRPSPIIVPTRLADFEPRSIPREVTIHLLRDLLSNI